MSISFKGNVQKLTWAEAREEVAAVNPELAKLIDELNPGKEYWLAKATYPYGSLVMQRGLLMLPNAQGDIVPITDLSLESEIREGLSYNLLSNPVSLVLSNSFEIYLPLEDRTIPLSGLIYAGTAFGAWRVLNPQKAQQPAFIWDMSAGARSAFMLPKITDAQKHMQLVKAYKINAPVPTSLMGHWEVFRQLANSAFFKNQWQAEILYFPVQWFNHLADIKWKPFYFYFHNSAWGASEYWRNQPIWNLIFSLILQEYESRPSAYIMDTVKYLLYAGTGAFPGLAPAQNNLAGPFQELQAVYDKEYIIKGYPPIIMQSVTFNMYDKNAQAVYYSLQFTNASEFKPSTRARSSNISDLHAIRSLMTRVEQEFISNKFNIEGTNLYDLFSYTQYDYFHNGVELHSGMRNSSEMPKEDKSFLKSLDGVIYENFPDSCSFVKGCIRLSHKKNNK
jgi:hypothetical protein